MTYGHSDLSGAPSNRPRWQNRQSVDYPRLRDSYAIVSIALSVIIMAFSGLFGLYPILLFYALWFPRFYYKGRFILQPSRDIAVPFLLVAYCIISVIWSDYPLVTARASLEFATMIACTIVVARITSVEAFIKGIIAGATVVLIVTLISNNYGQDYFSGDYTLVGLFGSKNQVGLFAEIALYGAIVYLFSKSSYLEKTLYFLLPAILSAACLYLSRSTSSVATLAVTLAAVCAGWMITKLAPHRRAPVLVMTIFFVAVIAAIGFYLGEQDTLIRGMGKDATLTGRTYLWAQGLKVGLEDPFFGHGYGAFWVPGQPEAERYWYEFQIFQRNGFHFHNMYIQTFVDLGVAGLALIVFMVLSNCIKSVAGMMKKEADLKSLFSLGLAVMFLMRGLVEVDYLGSFSIGCLLFFSIIPRLAKKDRVKIEPAPMRGKTSLRKNFA